MRTLGLFQKITALTALALGLCAASHAQLLVGQTVGVTGSAAATVKESMGGAALYINHVNAKGGVGGQKIEILTLDDQFDPKLTLANARTLIVDKGVLALFMTRGTPHTQGIIGVLDESGVPLIGPSTGAMVLHQPVQKNVFNVRAPYQREVKKAIGHLATLGVQRIGVIHVDDTFGADALAGALAGFQENQQKALFVEKFDRAKPDFSAMAPQVAKQSPQAVIFIGTGSAVVDGIKALRAAGVSGQIITLSNNASGGFVKALGEHSRGVVVTQVFPSERAVTYPLVREATALAREAKIDLTPAMVEGFTNAKVLVEALRRAGPNPTRARVHEALESLRKFDLGGLSLSYSADDHSGLDFSDLSIIGPDGHFRR